MSKLLKTLPVLALAGLLAGPAAAQSGEELTPDELRALFLKQKTRGLVIAPTTQENTGETATATAAATEEPATTTVAAVDQDYTEFDRDAQININISFDFDSSALRSDQKPKLANLCTVMAEIEGEVFRIVGHTDASGSASYNERLSLLRAQEVKRYFVSECGLPEDRLLAVGVGEEHPVNDADPRADENRRVEFQIVS